MSQRRSYSHSNDFNLEDLFRPEPGAEPGATPVPGARPPVPPQPAGPPQPTQPPPPHQHQQHQPPQYQSAPTGQSQGGPEFWGPPQAGQQPASETQVLPPYPAGSPGAPSQQPYGQQSYGQQSYGGRPPYPPGSPAYPAAEPGYGAVEVGYGPGGGPGGEGRRGPSRPLIIGGVAVGVVGAAVLVGVLLSGIGSSDTQGTGPVAKATGGSAATAQTGASPAMRQQATALSKLLDQASSGRTSVVNAVAAVNQCQQQAASQAALTQAATQRNDLVTKLAALKVDKLPQGGQLVDQLKQAWQASAAADTAYAAWAGDVVSACDPGKVRSDPNYSAAVNASGTATTAKKQASSLWNPIADQVGLSHKGYSEL